MHDARGGVGRREAGEWACNINSHCLEFNAWVKNGVVPCGAWNTHACNSGPKTVKPCGAWNIHACIEANIHAKYWDS